MLEMENVKNKTNAKAFENTNTKVFDKPNAKAFEHQNIANLEGSSSIYFRVPASIILDKEADEKRVSALSFFSIRRGMDNSLTFTINGMAKWLGRKPDRHSGGTNDKLISETKRLADNGYISLSGNLGNTSEADMTLNLKKISDECSGDCFAVIYLDELRKILSYDDKGVDAILLVFAWLRMRIMRRRNKLFPEEMSGNGIERDIEKRKANKPDAYDCYLYEIAEPLGLSARVVSKAIDALKEMKLIYSEQLPKTSYNGKWQTNRTIFCNWYKRENGSLLAYGEEYYMTEVKNKKKKLLKL